MAKKRYTKLEEEIIQILNEKDREPSWRRARLRAPRLPRVGPLPGQRRLGQAGFLWIAASFALALLAILVSGSSDTLASILAIASILIFLSPIVLSLTRRGGPPIRTTQRWRGRDIDLPPGRGGILGDLRYRIWQLRHRR